MAGNNDRRMVSRTSGGFFAGFANQAKLIGRLMMDKRVNPFLKLLPLGTLVYLIFPDIPGPIDDALVIWLGTYLFVELCPSDVVQAHRSEIEGVLPPQGAGSAPAIRRGENGYVEGEFFDVNRPDAARTEDPSSKNSSR